MEPIERKPYCIQILPKFVIAIAKTGLEDIIVFQGTASFFIPSKVFSVLSWIYLISLQIKYFSLCNNKQQLKNSPFAYSRMTFWAIESQEVPKYTPSHSRNATEIKY